MESQPLKSMLAQSKQLEQLVECASMISKAQAKQQALAEEAGAITGEVVQLDGQVGDYHEALQADLDTEYEDLVGKVKELAQGIEEEARGQGSRLDAFERRVEQIKVSSTDQFFLSKEILRCRNALASVES